MTLLVVTVRVVQLLVLQQVAVHLIVMTVYTIGQIMVLSAVIQHGLSSVLIVLHYQLIMVGIVQDVNVLVIQL